MIRIKKLVNHDRISIGLLAATLCSCLVALTATATTTSASIPERLLDRVRGANPSYYRAQDPRYPTCNSIQCAWLLAEFGITAVPWDACNAGNINTTCIQCAPQPNWDLVLGDGSPNAFPRPAGSVSCNPPADGNSGTCQLVGNNLVPGCVLTDGYVCDVFASVYSTE